MIEKSKVVVVNKFSTVESKVNSLVELIQTVNIDETLLDEKQKQFLYTLKQTALEF